MVGVKEEFEGPGVVDARWWRPLSDLRALIEALWPGTRTPEEIDAEIDEGRDSRAR
jgi:hypothetical protein